MSEPVPVNVVATDPMLTAGAVSAFTSCDAIALVAEEGASGVTVLIMDEVNLEILDAVHSAQKTDNHAKVVLVAADLSPAEAMGAIGAGARGLLLRREADAGRLQRSVLAAAAGYCTVPVDLLGRLLEDAALASGASTWGDGSTLPLTDRERSVLGLIAQGQETGEIARELCYSVRTVTSVMHAIMQRFRLRNRAHAVAYALRAGLL